MNRAMEEGDAANVLEMACLLLEELGDLNHGVKGQVGVIFLRLTAVFLFECDFLI